MKYLGDTMTWHALQEKCIKPIDQTGPGGALLKSTIYLLVDFDCINRKNDSVLADVVRLKPTTTMASV